MPRNIKQIFKKDVWKKSTLSKRDCWTHKLLQKAIIFLSRQILHRLHLFLHVTLLKPGSVAIATLLYCDRPGLHRRYNCASLYLDSLRRDRASGEEKPDYFYTCITMFDDYNHFRRENSFRTFYRRFSGFIFGTRNNFVSWLLNFRCAQDDTQRVEQEGRICARAHISIVAIYLPVSKRCQKISMARVYTRTDAHLRLIAAKSEKIPFFGRHQKKSSS